MSTASDLTAGRWVRSPRALWRRVTDGVLVLAPGDADPVTIGRPGDVIWALLNEPTSFDELVEILAGAFTVDGQDIAADVSHLLSSLQERGAFDRVA